MSSDFLYAAPRALFGAARTLDLGATFDEYNVSRSPAEADLRAMASDWGMVAVDLADAIQAFGALTGRIVPAAPELPQEEDDRQLQLALK